MQSAKEMVQPDAWEPTPGWGGRIAHIPKLPIEDLRALLAELVDAELRETGVLPRFMWDADGPCVTLDPGSTLVPPMAKPFRHWRGGTLYGVLACQLAEEIWSTSGLYTCSVCGTPYAPERRKPRLDKDHFCGPECRKEKEKETGRASARRRYVPKADRPVDGNPDDDR